jgi:hypothetical protein
MTQARCKTTPPQLGKGQHSLKRHHDTTSKHLTAPDPTTNIAVEEEHHHLAEVLVARTL